MDGKWKINKINSNRTYRWYETSSWVIFLVRLSFLYFTRENSHDIKTTRSWDLVDFMSLRFKALCGAVTVMSKRVAYDRARIVLPVTLVSKKYHRTYHDQITDVLKQIQVNRSLNVYDNIYWVTLMCLIDDANDVC